MIAHTCQTLTLRRFSLYRKTGDLRLLFKIHVPLWYAKKNHEAFLNEFNTLFNEESDRELDKLVHKLLSQNKILLMHLLLKAVNMHLNEKLKIDMMRNKVDYTDSNLLKYLAEIEEVSGIKVTNLEDMKAFVEEIERSTDKYDQLFPIEEPKKDVSVLQFAIRIFGILEMNYDPDITLFELSEMKILATEKVKAIEAQIEKYKNHG